MKNNKKHKFLINFTLKFDNFASKWFSILNIIYNQMIMTYKSKK